jgi:hypothetical protein
LNAVPHIIGTISLAMVRWRKACLDLVDGEITLFEILVHQLFVGLGGGLDHLLAPGIALVDELRGDLAHVEGHALRGFVPIDRLHANQIDHALEILFSADRHLDGHGIGPQTRAHLLVDLEEVGADPVHLVDERETGHAVLVGLAPDGLGLRLHTAHRAIDHARAVEHPHRALDFDREVDVPGGVDDVDPVLLVRPVHAFPETGGGSGRDRDATLLLLLHPVHGGRAIMHFTDLVVDTGVEQDALGGRGFSGVDVRRNADIAISLDRGLASHDECSRASGTDLVDPYGLGCGAPQNRKCAKALLASAIR